MISKFSTRRVDFASAALQFAADGGEFNASLVTTRLFSGIDQPKPPMEDRIIELYDQTRPSMLTYLSGLGLTSHEAEDVIHDCFVRLFDHLASKEDDRNLRGWLFRVAHNLAMDLFREGRRIQYSETDGVDLLEAVDSSSSPEEHAIQNEEIRRVRSALGRLTQQQRAAVLLRAEELRYREIASVLCVSTKRVSELIQRALVRLAEEQ
jgi:RNA polymerase sigma-70 factor (ECF subfamily)